jgi:3D (Asp-Asp-Asp) domain-containing protein
MGMNRNETGLYVLFIFAATLGILFMCCGVSNGGVLNNDTGLRVNGGKITVLFKGGTVVTLNGKSQVVKGTLARDTGLWVNGRKITVFFRGGTVVTFNGKSQVVTGTLANDTGLWVNGRKITVFFRGGTVVTFNEKSQVVTGTLARDTGLRVNGKKITVFFRGGTVVTFNEKSQVMNTTVAPSMDPFAIIEGTWKNTDHVHQGCKNVQNFCKAYKADLLFSKEPSGALKAQFVGQPFFMVGVLRGQTWNFSITMNGSPHGNGSFEFSPDFRSFKGELTDVNGHHVVWTGSK